MIWLPRIFDTIRGRLSDALNVSHYFKRIGAIDIQFGDPAFHLMRFAHAN